jgi:hypothetical protein
MELMIDLDNLKKSGIFTEEFILLQMINEGVNYKEYSFGLDTTLTLKRLEQFMWIKATEDGYILRDKGRQLFEKKNSDINFDEFWDVFPSSTPSGRPLRASSKEWAGKPTRDYVTCKKKYLSKIKTVESHNKIVQIVKARVSSKDYEFMNNMETYINQEKWQQDVKYLTYQPIVGKTNEMS